MEIYFSSRKYYNLEYNMYRKAVIIVKTHKERDNSKNFYNNAPANARKQQARQLPAGASDEIHRAPFYTFCFCFIFAFVAVVLDIFQL